jgi:opacity protein-like surface antigen
MFSARLPISICAAALLAASAAQAADYSQPVYVQPPPVIQEFSGWYLRGDIGFSNQSVGSLFNDIYAGYNSVVNVQKSFDAAPLFGLGVGYNFNNWLRFDVTGEYRASANFHGYDLGMFGGQPYPDLYNGSKSEWTFLFNGYVDLGTWWNVTPFVGAGVGVSRNTISNFYDISSCTGGCGNPGANYYSATASQWNFAWALYAGVGYQITKNLTLELAYRYIDLGNATTGTMVGYNGATVTPFEFRHLTSHDLKLGLRFNLDGFADCCRPAQYYHQPQVYMPPPPIYEPPLRSRG